MSRYRRISPTSSRLRMGRSPHLEIVLATGNRHKVRELIALLGIPGIRWRSLAEYPDVLPIKETGRTFEVNAIKKSRTVARATGCLALADDSGIEVDALHGAPGIYSARFAGRHGDDAANNRKLLASLDGLPASRRGAQYRCVLALASPQRLLAVTEGILRGRIAESPRGRRGFGYDPIFAVPRLGKRVAELPTRIKHRLSHRAQAARRMRRAIARLLSECDPAAHSDYRRARRG